jgi:hypothetical protein
LTTFEIGNPVLQCALAAVLALCGGSQEVPVVSTTGNGEFRAKINTQTNEIEYEFSYADMQAPVLQAHIHLGQHSVNGGIMVWLCQTAANPAPAAVADTPVCSSPAFSSIGIITAARIVRPGGAQQLGAGELAELVAALRAGVAYANVHTTDSPGGEIRGQIRPGHRH